MTEPQEKRALGDEWLDWDGKGGTTVRAGKWLYLVYSGAVFLIFDIVVLFGTYLIIPRLFMWNEDLPKGAWAGAIAFVVVTTVWLVQMGATAITEKRYFLFFKTAQFVFSATFGMTFRLAKIIGLNRDKLGHSFVKVSNSVTRALTRPIGGRLLILLPRCISREQIDKINSLKNDYPVDIAVVAGGEQARKKVRELRPTAVIGVACERDLVAGIRDISNRVSVIGIPNERPEGPCKNTIVDFDEVKKAVEFYIHRGEG